MRFFVRIVCSLICIYVFFAKVYAMVSCLIKQRIDLPVLLSDLIISCACVMVILLLWRKEITVRNKIIWCVLFVSSFFVQLYSGLFNYLIKSPMINQRVVLWVFDMPNLLSLFILLALMSLFIIDAHKSNDCLRLKKLTRKRSEK